MLKVPIGDIIAKIKEKTNLTEEVINKKIEDKISELSGLVSREGAAHIVANEFGVKIFQPTESGRLQIKNILPGLRNVSFLGRVLAIYPVREFKTAKREGKVASMLVGDETGKLRVVFWDTKHIQLIEEAKLKEGDIIKLRNGYVRESRMTDGLEVHTSGNTFIEVNPKDAEVKKIPEAEAVRERAERRKIAAVEEGAYEIRGAVVHVFETNPFFDVCPECGKRARDSVCQEHGEVSPKPSLVLSTIIDDGSSNMRVVFFGNRAQRVLGITAEEAFNEAKEHSNDIYPIQKRLNTILGHEIIVEGNVNKNSFSGDLEMIARRVNFPNAVAEAKQLLK
jgi:replication factor A1